MHVLLAEDDPVNQEIAKTFLEDADCDVDVVSNGLQAVEAVQNGNYDIVLMDVHMPEMDGITATKKIRQLPGDAARIPIIALTADAMTDKKDKFIAAGMNDFASKPFDIRELLTLMDSCINSVSD